MVRAVSRTGRRWNRNLHRDRLGTVGEVKRCGEVATDGTPPRADVRFMHAETSLQELEHGGVVEDLRADPASLGPRRDDDHGHARSKPDRLHATGYVAGDERVLFRWKAVEVKQLILEARFKVARNHTARLPFACERRHWGNDVVEQAVVFVVIQKQNGSAPYLGIFRERLKHLVNKICTVCR